MRSSFESFAFEKCSLDICTDLTNLNRFKSLVGTVQFNLQFFSEAGVC